MNSVGPPMVVVGVSGSSASVAALRWAADEARRRDAALRLISQSAEADLLVLGSPAPPAPAGRPVGSVIRACLRAHCPVVVGAPVRADVAASWPQPPEPAAAASPARRRELVRT
jgi:nucleotide-binding universal stress UspA family protein